jgi:hypothetical protein
LKLLSLKVGIYITPLLTVFSCEDIPVTDVSGRANTQRESPCLSEATNCLDTLKIDRGSFNYYSSFDLDSSHNIKGAIITVHGATRNGDDYFERMVSVVQELGLEEEIAVIAPLFITLYEKQNDLDWYWNTTSWKWGNQSYMSDLGESVSSFEVVDEVLLKLSNQNQFPSLSQVLITGHSSGAAFTQTYSSTKENNQYENFMIRFAVANSQYFLYPDSSRYSNQGVYVPTNCNNYDNWPLGFTENNPYIDTLGVENAKRSFLSNKVDYFIGQNDIGTSDMTSGCGYEILGENRYEKTVWFNSYMDISHPENQHNCSIVPDVGHNSAGMFSSEIFKNYLNDLF